MKRRELDAVCIAVRNLRDKLTHDQRVAVAQELAVQCRSVTPNFNEGKFYRGCGL